MKTVFTWIGVIVMLLIGGIVLDACDIISFTRQQTVNATKGVIGKTINADNIINQYEDFKTLASSYNNLTSQIKTAKNKIAQFKDEYPSAITNGKMDVSKLDKQGKERYNFLLDNTNAVENQRDNIASDYNRRVMMANRNIFRNTFVDKYWLPDYLPLNADIDGGMAIPDFGKMAK